MGNQPIDDVDDLTQLGSVGAQYDFDVPSVKILEAFPNKYPGRDYVVEYIFPEFTSLCPRTGQPDFATIKIRYIPDTFCVETKSLKLYFFAYRSQGTFMETLTNRILEDVVAVCKPRWCEVVGKFAPRGGIQINVTATFGEGG